MALRRKIDSFESGDVHAEVHFDGGMEPGGQVYMLVEGDDWELKRTFYFGSYDENHAQNFVNKLARDLEYRQRCIDGKTTWAQVNQAYWDHHEDIWSVFGPVNSGNWGDAYDEAVDLSTGFCEEFYDALTGLFGQVDDPSTSDIRSLKKGIRERAKKKAQELRENYAPVPADHKITFGKHEGKTIKQIVQEDRSYAEWAAKEMDNRPRIQKGFENALTRSVS